MSHVRVVYIDGTVEDFPETSRPGGSWHTTYRLEGGFCVIEDAYGSATAIPSHLIKKVETS